MQQVSNIVKPLKKISDLDKEERQLILFVVRRYISYIVRNRDKAQITSFIFSILGLEKSEEDVIKNLESGFIRIILSKDEKKVGYTVYSMFKKRYSDIEWFMTI